MAQRDVRPITPGQARIFRPIMRLMSTLTVWAYRASNGAVGGTFLGGAPVCLLTTTGRRSGEPRTTPLIHVVRDRDVLLVASQGGMDRHPVWYLNILSDARVDIQLGGTRQSMRARTASDEEKRELWPRLLEVYPDFDDYQRRTERDIPVVICSPDE